MNRTSQPHREADDYFSSHFHRRACLSGKKDEFPVSESRFQLPHTTSSSVIRSTGLFLSGKMKFYNRFWRVDPKRRLIPPWSSILDAILQGEYTTAMPSTRNTVIVALLQIGAIVLGVVAAGLCHKIWTQQNLPTPWAATILYTYSVGWLAIPIAWSVTALSFIVRPKVSDDIKILLFWLGLLTLAAIVGFVFYADVIPWFHQLHLNPAPLDET